VSLLLKLLDNFLMPDDVPPIKSDSSDDWVYALPGRKDDKQLHRLALANAEAEGVCVGGGGGGRLALDNAEAGGLCVCVWDVRPWLMLRLEVCVYV